MHPMNATLINDVDKIDAYNGEGLNPVVGWEEDSTATFHEPDPSMFRESYRYERKVTAPSDDVAYATELLIDSTIANPQRPLALVNQRPNGQAGTLRIRVIPVTGALGRIFVARSEDEVGLILSDGGASPFLRSAFFLSNANTYNELILTTARRVFVICVAAAVGAGGLVSYSSESFFTD